jgi:hypothetical protein
MAVSPTTDKAECSLPVDFDRREHRAGFLLRSSLRITGTDANVARESRIVLPAWLLVVNGRWNPGPPVDCLRGLHQTGVERHAPLADEQLLLELPDHVKRGRDARGGRCARAEKPHQIGRTEREAQRAKSSAPISGIEALG